METGKTCPRCGEFKLFEAFSPDKNKASGYKSWCKPCCANTLRAWRKNNLEKVREQDRTWYQKNKQKLQIKNKRRYDTKTIEQRLLLLIKLASKRKWDCSISIEDLQDIWKTQQGQCAYTKLPLVATANQFNTASLDRKDSSKGYTVGNIQLVCAAVNRMKQDFSEDLFLLLCSNVAQNNELSDTPENLLARYKEEGTLLYNAPNNISL